MRPHEVSAPSYEDVFRGNFDSVANFAEGRGALHAGEDIAQEAMLRLWRHEETVNLECPEGWLRTVTRNLVIDRHRTLSVRSEQASEVPSYEKGALAEGVPDQTESVHASMLATLALDAVSDDHRRVLELTILQGYTVAEAAQELSIPTGTVRSRQFYALRAARVALGELGITAST